MNQVIGDILPLALAVLISPIPIAAEIILLFSDRPKPNATAYVVGFLFGVGILLGVFTVIAATQDLSAGSDSAAWVSWLKIVLGSVLVLGGIRRFRNRSGPGESEPPKWMQGIGSFSPGKSLAVGLGVGALNPKNIVVGLAAGIAIASGGLTTGEEVAAIVAYAVSASLGVLTPLAVAVAMGEKSDEMLESWRVWLFDNNTAVMAVLLAVIGIVLIGNGIGAL